MHRRQQLSDLHEDVTIAAALRSVANLRKAEKERSAASQPQRQKTGHHAELERNNFTGNVKMT
jgi:hypothetical protein